MVGESKSSSRRSAGIYPVKPPHVQEASEARFDFPSIPLKNANCYASGEIHEDSFNTIIAKAGSKGCIIILELWANAGYVQKGEVFYLLF